MTAAWTGQRLRAARARRGWTQARAAEELGAGLRTWAGWERDEARPQAQWIVKLNALFAEPGHAELPPFDPHTIERALREATVVELLAELDRRFTALEAVRTPDRHGG